MLCNYRLDELKQKFEENPSILVEEGLFSKLAQLEGTGNFKEDGQTFTVGEVTWKGVSLFDDTLVFKESCELLVEVTNYKEIKPSRVVI